MTEYEEMKAAMTELKHYGTPRHSGRYPWGSGDNPYQRARDFLTRVDGLKKQGFTEREIAEAAGLTTVALRAQISLAKEDRKSLLYSKAIAMEKAGMNRVEIAKELGLKGESSVRSLLNAEAQARRDIAMNTANFIRDIVDEKGMVDIGTGVFRELNITKDKFTQAVEILKMEGYEEYPARVPQVTNKEVSTTLKILAKPGTEHKEVYQYEELGSLLDYKSTDGGDNFKKAFEYPASFDSKRLMVRYAEDGGALKDGVVEIRRGVEDISLGESNYAQVRILVDNDYYIKGMAVYSDNLPPGVDMIFNTNKTSKVPKLETLKKITDDPDNPFGSSIKENGGQRWFENDQGELQLSVINKRADEGDWGDWSKELSSQFLSKQPQKLINRQLELTLSNKIDELDDILALTNPTLKRHFLESYADDLDAASVHLKAASLPGQTYKVILPINSLKDSEVYAPHLKDGSEVTLVRYPHGGTFEIPRLTVNNRNKEGREVMTTNPSDAIGINAKVAEILSGADFDGDTVMVIPSNNKIKVDSKPPLKALEGFDPKLEYGGTVKIVDGVEHHYRGNKRFSPMKDSSTQTQMGIISNLITDMTLKGATDAELARAVKHSMVIIDANKHGLDYRQSYVDNGIDALHKKYQTQVKESGKLGLGASTLISKSKSEQSVLERKPGSFFAKDTGNELLILDPTKKTYIDPNTNKIYNEKDKRTLYIHPETGAKTYHNTGREFVRAEYKNSMGKTVKASTMVKDGNLYFKDEDGGWSKVTNEKVIVTQATTKSTKMAETDDAFRLSSGTPQEEAYANYANQLKKMANDARKEVTLIKDIPYNATARATYRDEANSLEFKLNEALLNSPRERRAQVMATSVIKAKKAENPRMTEEQEKKLRQQEISKARNIVGAFRKEIKITDNEWNAIQAGAISNFKLNQIINNADIKVLRQYAMPRPTNTIGSNKIRRLKNMANSGYTTAEIAEATGLSPSTINKYLKGD